MPKLTISFDVEYALAEGETLEDVAGVMYHATNTILGDSYLTAHQNIQSSVVDFDFDIKVNDCEDQALEVDGRDGCDYILKDGHRGCWITVGNLSTHLVKTDEGLVVDVYPKGDEGFSDPLASTWAFDGEGVSQ